MTIEHGYYKCELCQYKTTLKANFQLHCRTEKHQQRLQLVNHIREGGERNRWRLQFTAVNNPMQLKCNACDYYTVSMQKLQQHALENQHRANAAVFQHLRKQELQLMISANGGTTLVRIPAKISFFAYSIFRLL